MSGRDRDDDSDVSDMIDMLDKALDLVKEHEDKLNGFVGSGVDDTFTVREPLAEAEVKDDRVVVVAEARGQNGSEMSVSFGNGIMKFTLGDKQYEAEVPNDIVEESVSAEINNGVLRVEVERENKDDEGQEVDIDWKDESIVDEEEEDEAEGEDNGGDSDGSD